MVAEFRGGLCIVGSSFSSAEGAWMERQGSEGGISSRPSTGRLVCRAQGAAFSLKGVISHSKLATVLQLSHKKRRTEGSLRRLKKDRPCLH